MSGRDVAAFVGITLAKLLVVLVLGGGVIYLASQFGPGVAIGTLIAVAFFAIAWALTYRTRGARKIS